MPWVDDEQAAGRAAWASWAASGHASRLQFGAEAFGLLVECLDGS
jgi:hypothetical protein